MDRLDFRDCLCPVAASGRLFNILLLPSSCRVRMEITHSSFDTSMRKIYLYTTLIISFLTTALFAAPRLTVVAVVDGLTTENLTLLRPFWQQGGLRTLSEEAFQTGVAYPHLVYGGNETTATLVTGVTPDRHGYTMDNWFSRRDRRSHAMLEDESVRGIGTSLQLSAKALLSQTMTDKMRLQYPNAKIYGHHDFDSSKTCPNFDAKNEYKNI